MTSPTTPTGTTVVQVKPPPPSAGAILAGALFFLVGAPALVADYVIALANKQPPHILHIASWGGLCVLGILVPLGRYVWPTVQQVSVFVGDYLPGGRRRTDPPLPPNDSP